MLESCHTQIAFTTITGTFEPINSAYYRLEALRLVPHMLMGKVDKALISMASFILFNVDLRVVRATSNQGNVVKCCVYTPSD